MTPRLRNVLVYLRSSGLSRIKNRLDELLPLKNWINEMGSTATDIGKCIMEVLNSEEGLRSLYLTAPKVRLGNACVFFHFFPLIPNNAA